MTSAASAEPVPAGAAVRDVAALVGELLGRVDHGPRRLALAALLATLASGCAVALMGVSGWLLSRAAEHPPVLYLLVAAVGVRFFGIGRGVFRYFERLVGHELALRMQSALRLSTYDHLSRTTLLGRRYGDLLVRTTADVEAIVDVVVRIALPFCSASVVIGGTCILMGLFSPLFAVVLLGTAVVAGVVVPWLAQSWSRQADRLAVPARGRLADEVRQTARCATDLVAYGAAGAATERLGAVDATLRAAEARGAWTRGVAQGVQLLAAGLAVGAALVVGGPLVASGAMRAPNLAVLTLTPLALHEVFTDFTKAAQTLTRAQSALGRVLALLRADPVGAGDRPADGHGSDQAGTQAGPPGLRLHAVDVGWPGAPTILRGVDIEIGPGESVAVVGRTGIGKTTLAATIMGLIPARGGRIEAPGRIGYLAQDAHIFATSLAENVRIGNKDATGAQVVQAMRRAGLGLDPARVVGEEGATLSGGEAQRVALARLLVAAEPHDLVILDEPTEHLDHDTAAALLDDLFATLADTPLLTITHDADLMARCDRLIDLAPWAVSATR